MCCHLTGLWTFKNRLKHTQLNSCEKEELSCFLYLIQIFATYVVSPFCDLKNVGFLGNTVSIKAFIKICSDLDPEEVLNEKSKTRCTQLIQAGVISVLTFFFHGSFWLRYRAIFLAFLVVFVINERAGLHKRAKIVFKSHLNSQQSRFGYLGSPTIGLWIPGRDINRS